MARLTDAEIRRVLEPGLSHYQVLRLNPAEAESSLALSVARMNAAMRCHPDRWSAAPDELKARAHDAMARVNQAYGVLSDGKRKRHYDLTEFAKNFVLCCECDGKGSSVKQKGFRTREATPCGKCEGVGHFKKDSQ